MDEKTVFSGSEQAPPPAPPNQPPPPPIQPPQMYEEQDNSGGFRPSFSVGTLIKIIIGLFVLAVFGFVIVAIVLPMFSRQTQGEAKLLYWGLWEDENTIQPIIDDFEKKHPDIKVEHKRQDIKQYRKKLAARIDNNEGPDIFIYHNSWVPMLSDQLLPLSSDVIEKKEFESDFYDVTKKDLIKNGAIYGIPTGFDTLAMYTNPEVFEAAGAKVPSTWEDFIEVSRLLTVIDETGKIKKSGASLGTFENISHSSDIVSMLFTQNGADIYDLSKKPETASEALVFYTSFAQGDQRVWDSSLENSMIAFAKGNVGMYFGYSWNYFAVKAISPNIKIEIHPVPKINNRNMTTASYWVAGASSKSKFKKESLLFLKHLTSKESQEKLFSLASKTRPFGQPYPRKSMANLLKNSVAYSFVSQGNNAVSTFFASDTYDEGVNSQSSAYLKNAVNSIISQNSSPDTAVTTLSEGVSQVLKQHGAK